MFVSAGLWAWMFGWAVTKYVIHADLEGMAWHRTGREQHAAFQEEHVDWISPLFRPSSVACAGGKMFLADKFGIFELSDGGMHRVRCDLERSIIDVASFCQGTEC